jgi:hypothetical protein
MSVRSTVGFPEGQATPEIINPYPVSFNSSILLNGEVGPAGQVISSNGDGTMAWIPTGGAGSVPTLAQVLAVSNDANQLQITDLKAIASSLTINIDSDATINLVPSTGLTINGAVGDDGQVLTSQGIGNPPYWADAVSAVPTLGAVMTEGAQASADLNMASFDITNCTSISNSIVGGSLTIDATSGISITSTCNFPTDVPTCVVPPIDDEDLTNKLYVDALVAVSVGLSPSYPAGFTWVGPQVFENTTTHASIVAPNGANTIQSALAQLSVSDNPNSYYHVLTNTDKTFDPADYVFDATLVYTGNTDDAVWFLPVPSAQYVGCSFLFRNLSENDKNLQIQITGGVAGIIDSLNFPSVQTTYNKFTLAYNQYEFRMVCELFPKNGFYVWNLTYITPSAWYSTIFGGTNIYSFDT